jgi:hypothetical protein
MYVCVGQQMSGVRLLVSVVCVIAMISLVAGQAPLSTDKPFSFYEWFQGSVSLLISPSTITHTITIPYSGLLTKLTCHAMCMCSEWDVTRATVTQPGGSLTAGTWIMFESSLTYYPILS